MVISKTHPAEMVMRLIWFGSKKEKNLEVIVCSVDILKKDTEIKLIICCTEEENEVTTF